MTTIEVIARARAEAGPDATPASLADAIQRRAEIRFTRIEAEHAQQLPRAFVEELRTHLACLALQCAVQALEGVEVPVCAFPVTIDPPAADGGPSCAAGDMARVASRLLGVRIVARVHDGSPTTLEFNPADSVATPAPA